MQPPPPAGQSGAAGDRTGTGQWYAGPPPAPDPRRQDDEHLKLLVVFHYVMTVLIALFSLLPLIYVGIGALMLKGGFASGSSTAAPPPPVIGWFMIGIGGAVTVFGEAFAALTFAAARSLAVRRHWLFCMIIACLNTLHAPLGTALGVFTLIVLLRPSVKSTFEGT